MSGGGEWWVVGGRPNLVLAQVQVFGPLSLDLLDLTWDLTWTWPGTWTWTWAWQYWLPQLIPATNWKLLLSEEGHSWGYHQIENKHIKEVKIPSVSLNPSNPVLIYSTIKFLFLNDRQDVEIRMLCGYCGNLEIGSRAASRLICHFLSCLSRVPWDSGQYIECLFNRQDVTIYL